MRVLPHLSSPMPDSEHRSCPARRHTGRQRFYNLPEFLEIVPVPGITGMGLMNIYQGLLLLSESPRFAGRLDDVLQFLSHC